MTNKDRKWEKTVHSTEGGILTAELLEEAAELANKSYGSVIKLTDKVVKETPENDR